MKNEKRKLNLQLFAAEDTGRDDAEDTAAEDIEDTAAEGDEGDKTGKQVFTQAEVDRMISKIAERWENRYNKKLEEAEKLASMNAEEKAKYEIEKAREDIERSKQEVEQIKLNMVMEQNRAECVKILAEEHAKLAPLANLAVAQDAKTMKKNLDLIKKTVLEVANDMVDKRLKGYTPKKDVGLPAEITKEVFNKMSLDQQQELFRANKDLYLELIK